MYLKSYHLTCFIISTFLANFAICSAEQLYSIADLKKLAEQKNTEEFLTHYQDIPPSKRDETYQKMLTEMVIEHGKKITSDSFHQYSQWKEYDFIKSNEFYRQNLSDLFARFINNCFKTSSYLSCEKVLKKNWNYLKDHKLAINLVKTITPYFNLEVETHLNNKQGFLGDINLIDKLLVYSLKNPMAEFYCKDKQLYPNIKSLLLKNQTSLKLHPDCFTSLKPQIKSWFISGTLAEKNELIRYLDQDLLKNYLSLRKILATHRQKQKDLNLAWNDLEKLKNEPTTREQLLGIIDQDKNFSLEYLTKVSLTKRNLITKHIKKNFPEFYHYLDRKCSQISKATYCARLP